MLFTSLSDKRTSDKDVLTQYGYACKQLGIELKTTSVSQAKGLIERTNGTFQGRLVNELKLNGITTIEEANEYLTKNNIDLDNLNTGWQKADGTKLTEAEVLAVFENIYKDINGVSESGVKTYTYDELSTVNASLASTGFITYFLISAISDSVKSP